MSNGTAISEIEPSEAEKYIEGIILSLICVAAITGNVSMWIIICRSRELRTVTNSFILSLSVADLLVAVVNMPVTVISIFQGYWFMSDKACVFFGYSNMFTLVLSVMSLCNISINRYIMVCKPIYFKSIYTRKKATAMITACVTTSLILALPPLFGWADYAYIDVQYFCFCDWTTAPSYAYFMIGTCFGIPFSVMTVCNIFIFRTVRASKKRVSSVIKDGDSSIKKNQLKLTHCFSTPKDKAFVVPKRISNELSLTVTHELYSNVEDVTVMVDGATTYLQNDSKTHSGMKQSKRMRGKARADEIRLATALAIVVVVFVICWLPYCISMLLSIFVPTGVPRAFHMWTLLVGYANSCCNPVIYGLMNKKFSDGYRQIYCSCRKK